MVKLRLLDLGRVSYLQSQAIYHALAKVSRPTSPDTLVLLLPRTPYFSLGYHQHLDSVLDLDFCRREGLPIVRRQLGGGAVYLDGHQLFYQLITHRSRAPLRIDALYRRFLEPPVRALTRFGLDAALEPPNEIEVNGRRIAGTGAGQIGEGVVVVGNILFDFPTEPMSNAWRVPSEPFRELASEGLRQHITTLRRELRRPPSIRALGEALVAAYGECLNCVLEPGSLTPDESVAVRRATKRLASPTWLHQEMTLRGNGRLKISARASVQEVSFSTPAGPVRLSARLVDGRIAAVRVRPVVGGLENALAGIEAGGRTLRRALDGVRLPWPPESMMAALMDLKGTRT